MSPPGELPGRCAPNPEQWLINIRHSRSVAIRPESERSGYVWRPTGIGWQIRQCVPAPRSGSGSISGRRRQRMLFGPPRSRNVVPSVGIHTNLCNNSSNAACRNLTERDLGMNDMVEMGCRSRLDFDEGMKQ